MSTGTQVMVEGFQGGAKLETNEELNLGRLGN